MDDHRPRTRIRGYVVVSGALLIVGGLGSTIYRLVSGFQ